MLGIRNCVEFLRFAQALIDPLIIRTIKSLCFDSKADVGQKRLKRSKKKEEAKKKPKKENKKLKKEEWS